MFWRRSDLGAASFMFTSYVCLLQSNLLSCETTMPTLLVQAWRGSNMYTHESWFDNH
jgi:hypothetical protein